jgi:signal peptidase I
MKNILLISVSVIVLFSHSLRASEQTELLGYFTNKIFGNDMSPTFEKGDFIASDTSYYNDHSISKNDIILFESPKNDGKLWIKRVIAIPGEEVKIKSGKIYVNSKELHEKYVIPDNNVKVTPKIDQTIMLGNDQYYVLGDNRDNSFDSRFFGPITKSSIKAKVVRIYFSKDIQRIDKIK